MDKETEAEIKKIHRSIFAGDEHVSCELCGQEWLIDDSWPAACEVVNFEGELLFMLGKINANLLIISNRIGLRK